eukprot:1157035-Pelagomonas_calceolata.AAC.5
MAAPPNLQLYAAACKEVAELFPMRRWLPSPQAPPPPLAPSLPPSSSSPSPSPSASFPPARAHACRISIQAQARFCQCCKEPLQGEIAQGEGGTTTRGVNLLSRCCTAYACGCAAHGHNGWMELLRARVGLQTGEGGIANCEVDLLSRCCTAYACGCAAHGHDGREWTLLRVGLLRLELLSRAGAAPDAAAANARGCSTCGAVAYRAVVLQRVWRMVLWQPSACGCSTCGAVARPCGAVAHVAHGVAARVAYGAVAHGAWQPSAHGRSAWHCCCAGKDAERVVLVLRLCRYQGNPKGFGNRSQR